MAKAIAAFTGNNSYGVPEDYAQREDGRWFCRRYAWNGFGMGWTRWTPVREDLSSLIKNDVLDYGFKPLHRAKHNRLRLPA